MSTAVTLLKQLSRLKTEFGPGRAAEKCRLLDRLQRRRFARASQVLALHDTLCFMAAYPDDGDVLGRVRAMLDGFEARSDARRHRQALADTGVAGTNLFYRFPLATARWLADKWGDKLHVDWEEIDADRLLRHLPTVLFEAEAPGYDEGPLPVRDWVDRLRGRQTDATFLIRRFDALPYEPAHRARLYEELGLMIRIAPGPSTPSRTRDRHPDSPVVWRQEPIRRIRPNLREAVQQPTPDPEPLSREQARRLIDLTRSAMAVRTRDLSEFGAADPDDASLMTFDDGLQVACYGVQPHRRLLLEAVYCFLFLQNGVPLGYGLASGLLRSSEVALNIFETYRGAEAALVYARLLAVLRRFLDVDTFTVFPYQLGHENDEALESGAWWFYYKLGFRPRHQEAVALVKRELERMRRRSSHRSSRETLAALARHNLFLDVSASRPDVIGDVPLGNVGLAVTDVVVTRFGGDRARAAAEAGDEAGRLLERPDWRDLDGGEREAWRRWAPLVLALPGVTDWPAADRRALADVIVAKGGRREIDFVRRFDMHGRLRRTIVRLARRPSPVRA